MYNVSFFSMNILLFSSFQTACEWIYATAKWNASLALQLNYELWFFFVIIISDLRNYQVNSIEVIQMSHSKKS